MVVYSLKLLHRYLYMAIISQNQRSNLESNREVNRVLSLPPAEPFGVHRLLEENDNNAFTAIWDMLQTNSDIPETMEARLDKAVTLSPLRLIQAAGRRNINSYPFKKAQDLIANDEMFDSSKYSVEVNLGKVAVVHQRIIYAPVISDQVEEERIRLMEVLSKAGLKGTEKELNKPLHVTFGASKKQISRTEERHVKHMLNEVIEQEPTIYLQPWQQYSSRSKGKYEDKEDLSLR